MARYWRRRLRRRAFAGWQRGERKMITVDDKITYSPHRLNSSACESSSREGPVENNSGSGYRVEGCKEKDGPCGICGFSDWPKDCPGRKNDDGTTCAYIGQLQEVANRETLSAAYWKDKAAYYEQSYIALDVHMRNCPQSARQEMPSADEIKLACGGTTAQELRTAKAVLGWFIRRADKTASDKGQG